eukprot:15342621-Ditylum_brightwellii.AAC.1
MFQVQGTKIAYSDGKYDLHTFKLPCSCNMCLNDPLNINECKFLDTRGWEKVMVEEKVTTKYDGPKV